jgi:hypothetical protein
LEFYKRRQGELFFSLENISKFFQSSAAEKPLDQSGHQLVLEMLAMNLPSAPRQRLCSAIGSISKVLSHAIELLCSSLRNERNALHVTGTRLEFLESLCCVSAWLRVGEHDIDFSVGAFRCLAILKRKRPPGESSSKKIDTSDLLERLSDVAMLVQRLRNGLHNLKQTLHAMQEEETTVETQVINALFEGGLDDMTRRTAVKLKLMQQAMPQDAQRRTLPDFPGNEEAGKQKRNRREYKRRPRKRLASRSRNRVVGMFMQLDGGNEGGGDAYVDLEDFLVEG